MLANGDEVIIDPIFLQLVIGMEDLHKLYPKALPNIPISKMKGATVDKVYVLADNFCLYIVH